MASKDLDIKAVVAKLSTLEHKVFRYLGVMFIVLSMGMYSFLVFRINTLVNSEPSEDAITEKLQTVQRPRIDQSVVDKIQQLQDNSTEAKTLFQAARDNPFHE